MEDYQLRHDIDRLRRFLDELEILYNDKLGETDGRTLKDVFDMYYDQSEVESKSAVLKDSLKTLSESLIAFNQSLITFNGDTEALADDLTSLSTNLDNFLGDLSGLGESLELFDAQLNGGTVDGTTYTGFLSALNSLENYMYGKGETYNNQPCTYQNPSPTSLKGLLNGLGEELQNLDSGDTQLSLTLSALSNKLSGYSDTLASFKAEIENEVGSETYEALNNELIELAYEIATSNTAISNHQTAIQTVQGKIGSSDSTDTSTVFGKINGANSRIGAVEDSAEDLTNTLYAGANGTGSTSSPATGTVMKNLNTVKNTDVPALQNQIHGGNPQNPTSTSVMGRIDTVQERIGDEQTPNTIRYQIKDIDNQINNEQTGVIKQIEDVNDAYTELGDNLSNVSNHLYVGTSLGANGTTADPYDGTVMKRLLTVEDVTEILDNALSKFYNPSNIYTKILLTNQIPTKSLVNNWILNNGLPEDIRYCFNYDDGLFYRKKTNLSWSEISYESLTQPFVGMCIDGITPTIPRDNERVNSYDALYFEHGYFYHLNSRTYYEIVPSDSGLLGDYGRFSELDTIPRLFGKTELYDAIAEYFSPIGHTHSASEIMAHTHTIANITNLQDTLDSKANASTTYTKSEVNDALSGKANSSHTHTISKITNLQTTLNNKADKNSTYTKLQVDTALSSKANSDDTYTKTEVDTALSSKADKSWTTLYNGGMGTVRTDDNLVSVRIKTGSTAISSSDWTTMGTLGALSIPSTYYPQSNVYSPYLNGITVMINTDGEIKANRPAGQVNTSVEINIVYPVW